MESQPRTLSKDKGWLPTSFEDMVWLAYYDCVTALKSRESAAVGADGTNIFESGPSPETFTGNVSILESMLGGAGWLDAVFEKKMEPFIIKTIPYQPRRNDGHFHITLSDLRTPNNGNTQIKEAREITPFDLFAALTDLLVRRGFFKEKQQYLGRF